MSAPFSNYRKKNRCHAAMTSCRRLARGAFAAMELVLTLPILAVILGGIVEFSMLFYARSSVVHACRQGARTACLTGVQREEVEWEVLNVLPPSLQEGAEVEVVGGEYSGDVVAVLVSVPMNAACPDLLWPIGYSLNGRSLISETRMIKE